MSFQSASILWQLTKFDGIRKSVRQLRYNFINIFLQGHKSIFIRYSTPLRPTNGIGNVACFIFKKEVRFCNVLKIGHFSTLDSKIGPLVQLPHIYIIPANFPSMKSSIEPKITQHFILTFHVAYVHTLVHVVFSCYNPVKSVITAAIETSNQFGFKSRTDVETIASSNYSFLTYGSMIYYIFTYLVLSGLTYFY
jgi:hypothetical protein